MKLLIIEQDRATASSVRRALSEHGHVVDVTHDRNEGLVLVRELEYDLLILDARLAGCEDRGLIAALRSAGSRTPVLLLGDPAATAADRVQALRLGAADFLARPFELAELLARIDSVLRRAPVRRPETLRVADLDIEPLRYHASRAGKRLDLTLKEFQLLGLLARRSGEVLPRSMIVEHIWGMAYTSENLLDVHIRRLRSKVDDPFDTKLIHTVRGVGYVLEPR